MNCPGALARGTRHGTWTGFSQKLLPSASEASDRISTLSFVFETEIEQPLAEAEILLPSNPGLKRRGNSCLAKAEILLPLTLG
jgi:hypothetical protein